MSLGKVALSTAYLTCAATAQATPPPRSTSASSRSDAPASVEAKPSKKPCTHPFARVGRALNELGHPRELALLQLSLVPPVLMSPTGADYELRRVSQTTLGGSYYAEPVTIAAPYVTIGLSGLGYGAAVLFDDCPAQHTTSAVVLALFETLIVVGFEKWLFGRAWPNNERDPHAEDRLDHPGDARVYSPFAHGIDAAFPSGHTATMFAAAAALRASSPRWGVWRYMGYPVAVAVGLGMWWGDHHWASDVFSGALIGEAIGSAAGRAFSGEESEEIQFSILPSSDGAILSVSGTM